ncbi:uncharacterized protein AB675_450 [Cyphellophora attinorum]|uniref:Uncharacterized protein n=1 Tax=Cyphellophora attinorum TaxID=1664694 RepID=A0A0N1HXZ9_9EURO|nr:uncharacterized protein AB675_450 [Phialophora attinorum]KPI45600.1 hypothetical protein AB675_450 [Phialophora attinorum]
MSSVASSIQPLPDHVRSQITSTIEIRSLLDVAEHLFRNSLDANARVVRVQIDFEKGYCSVTDDGDGIEATEYQPGSFLAQEHCKAFFDLINDIFETSGFENDTVVEDAKWAELPRERFARHPGTKQRQSSSERVDRWSAFYLRIDRHDDQAASDALQNNLSFDNGSEMQQIIALLGLLLKRSLGRRRPTIVQDVSQSLARESPDKVKAELFDSFKRTKSAFPTSDIGLADGLPFVRDMRPSKTNVFEADVELLLADIELDEDLFVCSASTDDGAKATSQSPGLEGQAASDTVCWTNPKTGKLVRYNDNSFVVDTLGHDVQVSESEHECCDHEPRKSHRRWQQPAIDRKALAQRLKKWPSQTFASRTHNVLDTITFDGEEAPPQLLADQQWVDEDMVAQDLAKLGSYAKSTRNSS